MVFFVTDKDGVFLAAAKCKEDDVEAPDTKLKKISKPQNALFQAEMPIQTLQTKKIAIILSFREVYKGVV